MLRPRRPLRRLSGSLLLASAVLPHAAMAATVADVAGSDNAAANQLAAATTIELPLVVEQRQLGNVEAAIAGERLLSLDTLTLSRLLRGVASEELLKTLNERGSARISPEDLAGLGVKARFDLQSLSVQVELGSTVRSTAAIDFDGDIQRIGELVPAAPFALGLTTSLTHSRAFGGQGNPATAAETFGFVNIGGKGGPTLIGSGALRFSGSDREFERGRVLLFRDDLKRTLRYSAGDLVPAMPRLIGDVPLLGLSLERRFDELQPLRNVRPTGRRSFILERPSRIEVYADGALVRTLDLPPGPVDLRDISALGVATDVSVIVEDSFGRRELDSFVLSNDLSLLATGLTEFSLNIGLQRVERFTRIAYSRRPALVANASRGISDRLTVGAHAALAGHRQSVGVVGAAALFGGVLVGGPTFSRGKDGSGGAITLDYRGDPFGQAERAGQLTLRAEMRTRGYRTFDLAGFGDLTRFDLGADYRLNLSRRLSMNMGGAYFDRYGGEDPNWSIFGGLQANLSRFLLTGTARYASRGGRKRPGLLFTLSLPMGRHLVSSVYDSDGRRARLDVRRQRNLGMPEFDYAAALVRDPGSTEAIAQARLATSRFDLDGSVGQVRRSDGGDNVTRTVLRAQSGFGFVGGRFALGRDPGRGFVMVARHPSLSGTAVDVTSNGRRVAQANGLGPAVIPQASYRPEDISLDAINPPPGYDLGEGRYSSDPGAATGHLLLLGNDSFRSLVAAVVDPGGEPIRLRYGTITHEGGRSQPVFTNAEGRLVAANLAPGKYRLELDNRFFASLVIAPDSDASVDLGRVQMELLP